MLARGILIQVIILPGTGSIISYKAQCDPATWPPWLMYIHVGLILSFHIMIINICVYKCSVTLPPHSS